MKKRNRRCGAPWRGWLGVARIFKWVGKGAEQRQKKHFWCKLWSCANMSKGCDITPHLLVESGSSPSLHRVVQEKLTPWLKCHLLLIASCFCWACAVSKVFRTSRCWDKRVFSSASLCSTRRAETWEPSDNIHSQLKAFLIRPPRRWLSSLLIRTVILISFEDSFISQKNKEDKEERRSGVGGIKNNISPLKMSRNKRWQPETKTKRGLGSTCCCHFWGSASTTSH